MAVIHSQVFSTQIMHIIYTSTEMIAKVKRNTVTILQEIKVIVYPGTIVSWNHQSKIKLKK